MGNKFLTVLKCALFQDGLKTQPKVVNGYKKWAYKSGIFILAKHPHLFKVFFNPSLIYVVNNLRKIYNPVLKHIIKGKNVHIKILFR